MTRTEMDCKLTLMLFYEGRRQSAIKEAQFWQRRAKESEQEGLIDQAHDEQGSAYLWRLDANKWEDHINGIKTQLLESCHD